MPAVRNRTAPTLGLDPATFHWRTAHGCRVCRFVSCEIDYAEADADWRAEPGWYLVEPESAEPGVVVVNQPTTPLVEHTGLFRTLASLEPTPAGIQPFASAHGFLRTPSRITEASGNRYGESLEAWTAEISAMRVAVELWDAVSRCDSHEVQKRLATLVAARDVPERDNQRGADHLVAASSADGRDGAMSFSQLTTIESANRALRVMVNERLRSEVCAEVALDPKRTSPKLALVPQSLIGALWLQFADAMVARKAYRQCERCSVWFQLTAKMAAKGKMFCGGSCRMRDYRDRQVQAQALHRRGKPLREIAKALRSDMSTVRAWIGSETSSRAPGSAASSKRSSTASRTPKPSPRSRRH